MFKDLLIFSILCEVIRARGPHHPKSEVSVEYHQHYRLSKSNQEKITQDEKLVHDVTHTQEHMDEVADEVDVSQMSEDELEFYYFHFHDTDNNSMLDGLEILQAIHHTTHSDIYNTNSPELDQDIDYYTELIDRVLEEDDVNHDGYLSYPEYVAGRRKDLSSTT